PYPSYRGMLSGIVSRPAVTRLRQLHVTRPPSTRRMHLTDILSHMTAVLSPSAPRGIILRNDIWTILPAQQVHTFPEHDFDPLILVVLRPAASQRLPLRSDYT